MKKYPAILLILLVFAFVANAQKIEPNKIKAHIKTLASDAYEGRGTGSAGEKKANDYIESEFKKIKLLPKGENGYDQPFPFKGGVHGTGTEGTATNIAGYIDNGAENTIIIGAHYDHLGLGNDGSSLDPNPANKIHNGADDNASGTAGVIELARYFQNNGKKEKYNFLFLCFSGEELGLYGSKYFTDHPTIDLSKVNYMINLDMVGRLSPDTKALSVSGSGTSPVWEPLLQKLSNDKVKIKTDSSGTGPSDHTSFYLKNIPVLHFFTGSHTDYHKPSDDWDKINAEGEVDVLNVIVKVIEDLDASPKLEFLTTKSKTMSTRSSFKVTMGIMPSYTGEGEGLKVDGVSEGKPAQKAGLQAGDVITKMGDVVVKDIQNYMEALGKYEKGQTIPVTFKRKGETMTVNVTF
ncbi:MAG TPA: M20/M25/M40 family metallo-hydrolase [Cyclobacteriaceae bacterium]|nr:M20/M25/M40 family metallo-hydrolase [Cyclobacteriaceae bacterium]